MNNNSFPEAENIITGIQKPWIQERRFYVEDFGKDIEENIRPAVDAAIEKCAAEGGGRVRIPMGRFLCRGPIRLQSGVELHLSDGSFLRFSSNPKHYTPNVYCRWEGINLYNYSPMIYALNAKDIAITGKGVIDGGADIWSTFRREQKESQAEAWRAGAVAVPLKNRQFGETHKLRPSMLHLVNCRRILIEDVMLTNSPFWMIHPVYSKHITIRGVACNSLFINNDGADIDSCEEVLIENCRFTNGDDAIVMKSGRDRDGRTTGIPTRNVVIRNCDIPEALHGFAVGSELSGGVENIYVQNLRMGKINGEAIQFKSNKDRGGFINNIHIKDVSVRHAGRHLIFLTNDYGKFREGRTPTEFRGITLEHISCGYAEKALHFHGLAENPFCNIRLNEVHVEKSPCPVSCRENCGNTVIDNVSVNGVNIT